MQEGREHLHRMLEGQRLHKRKILFCDRVRVRVVRVKLCARKCPPVWGCVQFPCLAVSAAAATSLPGPGGVPPVSR